MKAPHHSAHEIIVHNLFSHQHVKKAVCSAVDTCSSIFNVALTIQIIFIIIIMLFLLLLLSIHLYPPLEKEIEYISPCCA